MCKCHKLYELLYPYCNFTLILFFLFLFFFKGLVILSGREGGGMEGVVGGGGVDSLIVGYITTEDMNRLDNALREGLWYFCKFFFASFHFFGFSSLKKLKLKNTKICNITLNKMNIFISKVTTRNGLRYDVNLCVVLFVSSFILNYPPPKKWLDIQISQVVSVYLVFLYHTYCLSVSEERWKILENSENETFLMSQRAMKPLPRQKFTASNVLAPPPETTPLQNVRMGKKNREKASLLAAQN